MIRTAAACALLAACSFVSLPRAQEPGTCKTSSVPVLVDTGIGFATTITAATDIARDLRIAAAATAFLAFSSAVYGAGTRSVCARHPRVIVETPAPKVKSQVPARREAWRLTKQATASDCATALAIEPRVRALDPPFHEQVFVPAVAGCIQDRDQRMGACRPARAAGFRNAIALTDRAERARALAAVPTCEPDPQDEAIVLAIRSASAAAAGSCVDAVALADAVRLLDPAMHALLVQDPDLPACAAQTHDDCLARRARAHEAANRISSPTERLRALRSLPTCEP